MTPVPRSGCRGRAKLLGRQSSGDFVGQAPHPRTASAKAMPRSAYCPWDPAKVKCKTSVGDTHTPCNLLVDRAVKPEVAHKPDGQVGNGQT